MAGRLKTATVNRVFLGIVLALAVVEGGLRLVQATPLWRVLPVVPPILGMPDKEAGIVFQPGAKGIWIKENRAPISINSLGLRDSELIAEKPSGVFRVALTGDSYVEALQVSHEHTFEALSERQLADRGHRVEIANLAMSGHGPLRQLVRLRRRSADLDPDMVISFIRTADFLSGEFADDTVLPAYVEDAAGNITIGRAFQERFVVRHANHQLFRVALWTVTNVEIVRMLYKRFSAPPANEGGNTVVTRGGAAAADACNTGYWRAQSALWLDHSPNANWRRTEQFFNDYAQWINQQGLPALVALVVNTVPDGALCRDIQNQRDRIMARITKELTRRGLMSADFSAAVSRRGSSANPQPKITGFGARSGHLNYAGHVYYSEVLTDLIATGLSSGGWTPR